MPAPLTLAPRRLRAAVITLLLIGAAAALVLASAAPAHARGRAGPAGVPNGFVGVDIDGPLFNTAHPLDLNRQMGTMISNGVESIRAAFNWAAAQPYASWSHVPSDQRSQFVNGPAGRPISFVGTDAIVGDAAKHGITVLPTLLYAPGWDAHPNRHGYFATPKRDAPYAEFAGAMVRRYGPHGSFWSKNPQIHKVPIRMWQIWNEPNIATYWPQPFARSYVSLLRLAHNAIKQADRGAKVVLGGLTNLAWHSIGSIYRIGGARRLFDAVSVNGFSGNPANVILYLRFMRHAMDRYGDATKPMIASELSWPSARGQTYQHFAFNTTQNGQARDIAQLLPLLGVWRTRLVLSGFYYYTWMGLEFKGAPAFSFAGLVRENKKGQVKTKPALNAFRRGSLALESCRAKGPTATRCLH